MTDEPELVTVNLLMKVTCRTLSCLDSQDSYTNTYACNQYPELILVTSGPKGKGKKRPHTRTYFVDGLEVPDDPRAIADAINAYRSRRGQQ